MELAAKLQIKPGTQVSIVAAPADGLAWVASALRLRRL
jgi:hypothetical protein